MTDQQAKSFNLGPWTISVTKGAILTSDTAEGLTRQLNIPQIPEMTFGDNEVKISHSNGFSIAFTAIDALRLVDGKNDLIKVAVSEEWIASRRTCEFINKTVNPFDWTYSTNYQGTIIGDPDCVTVEETSQRISIDKLKVHEKILFFEHVILFEDELADHGCAELSVKIRVMPSCFFLLLRYFLRVDGLLARIHDTRLFHEFGSDYLLREYAEKESSFHHGSNIPFSTLSDANLLDKHLKKKLEICQKLVLAYGAPKLTSDLRYATKERSALMPGSNGCNIVNNYTQ